MGVPLLELRIEEPRDGQGESSFALSLWEANRYPPDFGVSMLGAELRTDRSYIDGQSIGVGNPAELDRGPIPRLELPSEVAEQLLASPLVETFLSSASQQDPFGPLRGPVGRIVVVHNEQGPDFKWHRLASSDSRFRGVAWVHHYGTRVSPRDFGLDFPLRMRLWSSPGQERSLGAFEDMLFDSFVREAREQGGIVWGGDVRDPHLLHIAAATARDAESITESLREWPALPRLVVLDMTEPHGDEYDARKAGYQLLEAGVGAVVVARADEHVAPQLFQLLYRKLMHNWPIEYCVSIGLDQQWSELAGRVRTYSRPGGEFGLSLSRVPAERAVLSRRQQREQILDDRPKRSVELPKSFSPDAAVPPLAQLSDRERRAAREVAEEAHQTLLRASASPDLGRANEITFASEGMDLREILDITHNVEEIAAATTSDVEAIIAIARPAPRRTNVTVRDPSTKKPLPDDVALRPQKTYAMSVEIAPHRGAAQVSEELNEERLRKIFETEEYVDLDIVVFAPDTDFAVSPGHQRVRLPRVGPSEPGAVFEIVAQREGWCRLRVAVYFRNTMLQSVAMEAFAGVSGEGERPTIRPTLDWVASTDLLQLAELPDPIFNVFVNDAPDGTHWMGVFSADHDEGLPLESGQMRTFDSQELTQPIASLRAVLQRAHGEDGRYEYPPGTPEDDAVIQFGLETMRELALESAKVYNWLFESATDWESTKRLDALIEAICTKDRRLISIARTSKGKWTAPWAALYDLFLDVNHKDEIEVCEVFRQQLADNEWDGDSLVRRVDLLDDPAACRAQAACPLSDEKRRGLTVCPFGFWGFRHEIEQPIQNITAAAEDELPEEMQKADFSQASMIIRQPGEAVRVAGAFYPFTGIIDDHIEELEETVGAGFVSSEDREEIMGLLKDQAGHHLFYFYCHGVPGEDDSDGFALQVGPMGNAVNTISSAAIDRRAMHWAEEDTPQPLVILIACDSLAVTPENMNAFFGKFKNAHASGLVGSEISIGTDLGRGWGLGLVRGLLEKRAIGDTFLGLRHDLLRRYNPLGLAFTSYAPATLHIHEEPEDQCPVCARRRPVRAAGGNG